MQNKVVLALGPASLHQVSRPPGRTAPRNPHPRCESPGPAANNSHHPVQPPPHTVCGTQDNRVLEKTPTRMLTVLVKAPMGRAARHAGCLGCRVTGTRPGPAPLRYDMASVIKPFIAGSGSAQTPGYKSSNTHISLRFLKKGDVPRKRTQRDLFCFRRQSSLCWWWSCEGPRGSELRSAARLTAGSRRASAASAWLCPGG